MKFVPTWFQFSATLLCCFMVAFAVPAQVVVTNNLVFEAHANTDTDGSDGWDFTQPAVAGGGGTLDLTSITPPTHNATLAGGGYFSSDPDFGGPNPGRNFGGSVTPVNIFDFTFEIWIRRNGENPENQFASFRLDKNFGSANFFTLAMQGGNPQGTDNQLADIDFRDNIGTRQGNLEAFPLPIGEWRQVVITYQDVSATNAADGVMNVYSNGNQTPMATFTNNVFMAGGSETGAGSELAYVTTHVIAEAEGTRGIKGDIAIVRIYTAVLTPAEVEQNFLADIDKYAPSAGLPEISATTLTDQLGFVFTGDVPGLVYELECSDDGTNFVKTGALVLGNGGEQILFDPRGTPTQAVYLITDNAP
jgi:hypothetical protein